MHQAHGLPFYQVALGHSAGRLHDGEQFMRQDKKPAQPSQQDPEQGNEVDPRLKEPYGPEGYRSGIDEPGSSSSKNPGQANPAHNTPGRIRQDQPGQHDLGEPGQAQTQSYPGIKGPKARELQHDGIVENDQATKDENKNVGTARRNEQNGRNGPLNLPKK